MSLQPTKKQDEQFLYEVYASTRADELALTDWSDAEKAAFLAMQFNAQQQHYQRHYADADFLVILVGGEPAGRLYVARWEGEIRIVDIALLPAFRGQGIGTHLIGDLLTEGQRTGKKVSIHVEKFNPALRLYDRLGFHMTEDKGVYLLMEWHPSRSGQRSVR